MTTTLVALSSGYLNYRYVAAIEGYSHLLSSATQAQTQAAWSTTDWAGKTVLTGLVVELNNRQSIDPWEAFTGGGKCVLKVPGEVNNDTFGIDVAKTAAGVESLLTATMDRTTNYVQLQYADDFPSGIVEAHIGTECIEYIAKGGNALDLGNLTQSIHVHGARGKYSPFGTLSGYAPARFANHHRVYSAENGVRMAPVVSQYPRSWRGRRVGVWMHVVEATGQLNSRDDAQLVFAGRIEEPGDDAETGWTTVDCSHVLDEAKNGIIGREMFEGTLRPWYYLLPGQTFHFSDYNGASSKVANDLTIVAGGATGTNQVNEGYYSLEEICSFMNAWLAAEQIAGRIYGNYQVISPTNIGGETRSVMRAYIPSAGTVNCFWGLNFPTINVGKAFGQSTGGWFKWIPPNSADDGASDDEPQQGTVFQADTVVGMSTSRSVIDRSTGTFYDQYSTLPAGVKVFLPPNGGGFKWGVFVIDNKMLVCGRIETANTNGLPVTELRSAFILDSAIAPTVSVYNSAQKLDAMRVAIGSPPPTIRQVFIHEGPWWKTFLWFALSTGTLGYNGQYDILPYGHGLGLPYEIAKDLETTLPMLSGATETVAIVVDKQTKFSEVFGADMVLRRAHLVWRNESLRATSWSTPNALTAVATLTESTKAEPADAGGTHRAPSINDSSKMRNLVKLNYNRDITQIGEDGAGVYRGSISLEDATSVDDMGGQPTPFTLNCRNLYGEYDQTGSNIRRVIQDFLAWMPCFSRPLRKVARSLAMPYWEGLGVDDVVFVSDPFVRDNTTGTRRVTLKPGIVVDHGYNPGGVVAGDPNETRKPFGECTVVFLPVDRTLGYAPCAEVDYTQSNGGYNAGTNTLSFFGHNHSEILETVDVGYFSNNDNVKIIEVDPATLSAPQTWDVSLTTVTPGSNTAVVNSALTGWDPTKRYRMVPDSYADTQTSQRTKSFQAGSNGTIVQLSPPDQYGLATSSIIATPVTGFEVPELIPDVSWGANAGAPRDCGYDRAMAVLANNLMDYKTARSSPSLLSNVVDSTPANTGYTGLKLLMISPMYIGDMLLTGTVGRWITMAPYWRNTSSASNPPSLASLRVSISGYMPTGSSLNGVTIKAPAVANLWQNWSPDTSWQNGPEKLFPLLNFNNFPWVYVIIEGTINTECLGLCWSHEGARFFT